MGTLAGPMGLTYKNYRCCSPIRPAGGKTFLDGPENAEAVWVGVQRPAAVTMTLAGET